MNEVLEKYQDNPAMLLRLLAVILGEISERYADLQQRENLTEHMLGQLSVFTSMYDYFDLEFLNDNFTWLYYKYGRKVLDEEEV